MPERALLPKYQSVLQSLEQRILTGRYRAGEKLPGEAGLVREFGASRITIGRAVRELQRRGLVQRRAGSGTYVRSRSAGAAFGLLIPDLGRTEIFDPVCQGIAAALRAPEEALVWGRLEGGSDEAEQALQLCTQFLEREVSGVFFAPLERAAGSGRVNQEIADRLAAAGIAVVLLDRDLEREPARSRFDLVGLDNRRAGMLAATHLLSVGCRRIGFVSAPGSAPTVATRIAGYREALIRSGHSPESSLVCELDPFSAPQTRAFLDRSKPDAVICANDRTAAQWQRTLLSMGIAIPGELALCGIDDVEYASLLPVPLTTIRQPCAEIGRVAMGAMRDRLAAPDLPPREILLTGELVVRDSCGYSKSTH